MKVRIKLQPAVEVEVDEHDKQVLEHQGLLWSGTDAELAAHYADAELPLPPGLKAAPTSTTSAVAGAGTDKTKEG